MPALPVTPQVNTKPMVQYVPPVAAQTTPTALAPASTYTPEQTTGLISATAAQAPGAISAAATKATGLINVTAANATQDQNLGTVSGQVRGLIAANDPLQQQAETYAKQQMALRGGQNSSMAIGAAVDAQNRAALPIASADAAANNQFALTNAGYQQQTNLANAGAGNQFALTDAANTQQTSLFNAGAANDVNKLNTLNAQQTNLSNADTANKINILNTEATNASKQFGAQQTNALNTTQAQLDATAKQFNTTQANALVINQLDQSNKIQLADIQATYQTQIQGSASSAAIMDRLMTLNSAVMADPNMDAASKQNTVKQNGITAKAALSLAGAFANQDIKKLITFA